MKVSVFFFLIILLFYIPLSAQSKRYFVATAGDDRNDGLSSNTPWKSLHKVSSTTFLPGDTISFKRGDEWRGQLWPKGDGTRKDKISVNSYGEGSRPKIHGHGTTYPKIVSGAVMLYNQSYWEIEGLEVTNYALGIQSSRAGILMLASSPHIQNHIRIRNCFVHSVNSPEDGNKCTGGIILFGTNIDKDGNEGDYYAGFNDVIVENNTIFNVSREGIRNKTDNAGHYKKVNSNIIIRGNDLDSVSGDGIVLAEIFEGGLIENNRVNNVAYYRGRGNYAGVWTHYSSNSIIQHNHVSNIRGGYHDGEAFDADNSCDGDIFQYNFSYNNVGGFMLMMASAKNITVRYNISVNDGWGKGQQVFHWLSNNSHPTNLVHNNTIYVAKGTTTTLFGGYIDSEKTRYVNFVNNVVHVEDGAVLNFADHSFHPKSTFFNNNFYSAIGFDLRSIQVLDNCKYNFASKPVDLMNVDLSNPQHFMLPKPFEDYEMAYPILRGGAYDFYGKNIDVARTFVGAVSVNREN